MIGQKTCFVIMPISDHPDYDPGHFTYVYQHLIAPACEKAGFKPVRADDVLKTNEIVLDILHSIATAEMAICDLSSLNPNVLYELGIRHALGKPVCLIKDNTTKDIFDIKGLRYINYDQELRVFKVNEQIEKIRKSIEQTYENSEGSPNSLIPLLEKSQFTITANQNTADDERFENIIEKLLNIENHLQILYKISDADINDDSNSEEAGLTRKQVIEIVTKLKLHGTTVVYLPDIDELCLLTKQKRSLVNKLKKNTRNAITVDYLEADELLTIDVQPITEEDYDVSFDLKKGMRLYISFSDPEVFNHLYDASQSDKGIELYTVSDDYELISVKRILASELGSFGLLRQLQRAIKTPIL